MLGDLEDRLQHDPGPIQSPSRQNIAIIGFEGAPDLEPARAGGGLVSLLRGATGGAGAGIGPSRPEELEA